MIDSVGTPSRPTVAAPATTDRPVFGTAPGADDPTLWLGRLRPDGVPIEGVATSGAAVDPIAVVDRVLGHLGTRAA